MQSEVTDLARGMLRVAVTDADGALLALLFVTRKGSLPDRDWIVRQFAAPDASHCRTARRPPRRAAA